MYFIAIKVLFAISQFYPRMSAVFNGIDLVLFKGEVFLVNVSDVCIVSLTVLSSHRRFLCCCLLSMISCFVYWSTCSCTVSLVLLSFLQLRALWILSLSSWSHHEQHAVILFLGHALSG